MKGDSIMLDKNDLQAIAELISASEQRMTVKIEEAARDAVSQSIAYSENTVERKLDVIKEGLDLALELPRVSEERVDRIETDVDALKFTVRQHSGEIEKLKKAQ